MVSLGVASALSMNSSHPTDLPAPPRKRGLILRLLYRVYTNYLGVTPPTPAQERIAAVVLIGGVVLGLAAVVVFVLLMWQTISRGGQ
jgi:hypothetical protein